MKTKNLLLFLILTGFTLFVSCEKDPDPLTQKQAEEELTNVSDDYDAIKDDYDATQGIQVEYALDEIGTPFNDFGKKLMMRSISDDLKRIAYKPDPLAKKLIDDDFDFEEYVGTWDYSTTNGWTRTSSTPTDQVILRFPYPLTNTSNNAVLTYYEYKTTSILFYGYPYVVTSGLKAKLEFNGQQIWSLTYSGDYSSFTDFSITITKTVGKYTLIEKGSTKVSDDQATYTGSFEVKKDGKRVYMTSSSGVFKYSNDQTWTASVTAKIIVMNIEIRIEVDYNSSSVINDTTISNFMKISIWTTDGAKVGDIKIEYNPNTQDYEPYIYFTNGESAPASNYMGVLLEEIGSFIRDLFDEGEVY